MTDSDKERALKCFEYLKSVGNELKKFVYADLEEDADGYGGDLIESIIARLEDIRQSGCVSGMVGGLCYYHQTSKVFDEHKEEIEEYVNAQMGATGSENIYELIPGLDKEDPFMSYGQNKNAIVWYVYEMICCELNDDLENEDFCIEE